MSETPEIRLKRLRMRAWHRGIKEMDLILGGWADRYLADADAETVDAFEVVLAEADHDLYQWVSGQAEAPAALAPMIARLAADMKPTLGQGA
ncbi:succinate dehydrogenase assembly factor 2 [Gymnodinialimonas hymeniacidonis]|uniref:FAD assembly factor SdhE n=1 Tax=Gymnodinialimonas hymeniacidonis TaxID=3126508 RepID=UPI0034C5BAC3